MEDRSQSVPEDRVYKMIRRQRWHCSHCYGPRSDLDY
jgi:hypothetical protein